MVLTLLKMKMIFPLRSGPSIPTDDQFKLGEVNYDNDTKSYHLFIIYIVLSKK